jgi:lycopene cyclase domain-containing protein
VSNYAYLATILVFGGGAVAIIWIRQANLLRPYAWFVISVSVLAAPFAFFESFGLRWKAWAYNPRRTFHVHLLGAEIESYLFMMLVAAAVVSATIVYAAREDRRRAGPMVVGQSDNFLPKTDDRGAEEPSPARETTRNS